MRKVKYSFVQVLTNLEGIFDVVCNNLWTSDFTIYLFHGSGNNGWLNQNPNCHMPWYMIQCTYWMMFYKIWLMWLSELYCALHCLLHVETESSAKSFMYFKSVRYHKFQLCNTTSWLVCRKLEKKNASDICCYRYWH